jgi:hypothetical protein
VHEGEEDQAACQPCCAAKQRAYARERRHSESIDSPGVRLEVDCDCESSPCRYGRALRTSSCSRDHGVARIQESHKGCNVRLKGLKTLSDPQRKLVNLHPNNTTIAAMNALPEPHPTPKARSTDFSRRVWRVSAKITEFKIEGDSDIHLVLFGDGGYLIAKMPAAGCLEENP